MTETIFKVGERVRFKQDSLSHLDKETVFLIMGIKPVPKRDIKYNPFTQTGGAGHSQWLILNDNKLYSGLLLEKVDR